VIDTEEDENNNRTEKDFNSDGEPDTFELALTFESRYLHSVDDRVGDGNILVKIFHCFAANSIV
jgi:hypothetical protein